MFSFSSLDNRTEENHTETIMSNYSACSLRFAESVEVSQRYIVWHFSSVLCEFCFSAVYVFSSSLVSFLLYVFWCLLISFTFLFIVLPAIKFSAVFHYFHDSTC